MHEPCGLDAAQRQFYRAIAVLVIAWWQRRKMPARSGILPMAAAALLGWLCDLVGWWLLIPLYIVVGRVLWRVIWS